MRQRTSSFFFWPCLFVKYRSPKNARKWFLWTSNATLMTTLIRYTDKLYWHAGKMRLKCPKAPGWKYFDHGFEKLQSWWFFDFISTEFISNNWIKREDRDRIQLDSIHFGNDWQLFPWLVNIRILVHVEIQLLVSSKVKLSGFRCWSLILGFKRAFGKKRSIVAYNL